MSAQTIDAPWKSLAFKLLDRAKCDAQHGDLGALAWLVTTGADVAEALAPAEGGALVLAFCQTTLATLDTGKVKAAWRV